MGSVPEKAGTSTATRSGKVVGTLPWSSCCSQKWRRSFKDDGVEGSVVWWESESAESQQRGRPAMEMVFGEDGEARLGDRERAHGQQGQRGLPGWRQMDRWRGVRGLVQMAWTQVANPRKCSPTHLTSWGVHKFILACCSVWSGVGSWILLHSVCWVSSLRFWVLGHGAVKMVQEEGTLDVSIT